MSTETSHPVWLIFITKWPSPPKLRQTLHTGYGRKKKNHLQIEFSHPSWRDSHLSAGLDHKPGCRLNNRPGQHTSARVGGISVNLYHTSMGQGPAGKMRLLPRVFFFYIYRQAAVVLLFCFCFGERRELAFFVQCCFFL